MGSYTSSLLTTPVRRIIVNGSAAPGDKVIITLNGVDVTYVVQAGDLDGGYVFTAFPIAMANAINASTAIDPVSKVPINHAFCAAGGLGNNVGTRDLIWCGISVQPGYDHAFTISTRYVPVTAGALSPLGVILSVNANYVVTVQDTIPAGSVLTTMVNAVSKTYTVVNGDTAASILPHLAQDILAARPHQISTVTNGNSLVIFNGTSEGAEVVTVSLTPPVVTEKPALYVSGRFLHDRHGNQVILRGVNYAPLDTYEYPGVDYLDEVLQTGANAIRIAWWITYPGRPAFSLSNLTNLIDRCIAVNVVPIVEMAQIACPTDTTPLNAQLIPWWTSPDVVAALQPRQSCLILNLANELGQYQWAEDSTSALAEYVADYTTALQTMRKAGYVCPLMIDAPDCGISNQIFPMIGAQLVAADPNILLSAHAYWAGYDGTGSVMPAVTANLPIIFGEVANKEGDPPYNLPIYDLDGIPVPTYVAPPTMFNYKEFITNVLQPNAIGWLMWSWYPDDVPERNMSSDGSFASLTAYGQDVVGNGTQPVYGLKSPGVAKKIVP